MNAGILGIFLKNRSAPLKKIRKRTYHPIKCYFIIGENSYEVYSVYDINHIYALQIKNTSESGPQIYKATEAVAKKAQRLQRDSNP